MMNNSQPKITLPKVIEAYQTAFNQQDMKSYLACFSNDASIYDEGEDIHCNGLAEIEKWCKAIFEEYQLSMQPLEVSQQGEEFLVKALVSGNFDGSPIVFHYIYLIENDKIERLKISVAA